MGGLHLDPFSDVHLDPARDPPERDRALFELLGKLWGDLGVVRPSVGEDPVLEQIVHYAQNQLIACALVLSIKMNMVEANEKE